EGREARDEGGAGPQVVGRGEGVAHPGQAPVAVDDSLRGAGGAGGEEDRGVVVDVRLGRQLDATALELGAAVEEVRQGVGDAESSGGRRGEPAGGDPAAGPGEHARTDEAAV